MFRLLALRLTITVWKRSLSISSKLRPRTWIALAIFHACLALISLWAYQAKSVADFAIPPVSYAEVGPVPIGPYRAGQSIRASFTVRNRGNCDVFMWRINGLQLSPTVHSFTWRTPN